MSLEVRRLRKAFGSLTVSDGIDLSVAKGEAVGIIGPNGAGKSSLFNLIAGSLVPDRGAILLDGADITELPAHKRCLAGIGRTHQIHRPFNKLTVFENVLVGAVHGRHQGHRSETADFSAAILEKTGLISRANALAGSLTLLQRKRLELARALATEPTVLLLDEIAGGLTERECEELIGTIRSLQSAGLTIVWIEHIVHALISIVTRLVVLNFGRKIADGPPLEVVNSAKVREIYMGIEA